MEEWFQFAQSLIIGIIFSFLLAKLISIVVSFKENNLTLARSDDNNNNNNINNNNNNNKDSVEKSNLIDPSSSDSKPKGTKNVAKYESETDSDDDWEGVESTELDEAFSAATAFVAATAADVSSKVSNDVQLQLYGYYKIATEGPCTTPQPSAFKMTARAKWQAWQKLGAMPTEDAMLKYIEKVTELFPTWIAGSSSKAKGEGSSDAAGVDTRGPMGPVFSSLIYEEESGNELEMDAIHAFAREGEGENLLKCIDSGVPVNSKDSEGRTPLHWAVDRGHLNIIELLVSKCADINAKDNEGQSPLHYAAVCEREEIGEFLVKKKADIKLKDNDGNSPFDLCDLKWPWLKHAVA